MRIRFTADAIYETGGFRRGPKFAKGYVLDIADVGAVLGVDASAEWAAGFLQRWVQRGLAEPVDRRAPTPAELVARREEDGDPAPEAEAVAPAVTQPLGTAKRGRPTKGIDEAES